MFSKSRLFGILILLLLLNLGFSALYKQNQNTPILNERVTQRFESSLTIDDGSNKAKYNITQFIGTTIAEATAIVSGSKVITRSSPSPAIVSISGRAADLKKKESWQLFLNGNRIDDNAGRYIINNYDNLEWKLVVD